MIGDKELVDLLLKNGANPHYYDCRHHTMLHLAAKLDQPRMIFYISKVLGLDLDQPDLNGDTALHHAVRDGRVLSTIWLSSLGADCNKFNRDRKTPFHLALESAGKKEKEHTEVASKETIDMIVRALLI
jgi:ankyrin repeat protein